MQIEYHNGTRLLCVIGDPIGHSLSPLLHNTMLRELHEDALYLAVPVPAGTVGEFVAAAKTIGIQGFNLTMPHKEDILPYLSEMTPEAKRCHSVNSVRIRDGKLEGLHRRFWASSVPERILSGFPRADRDHSGCRRRGKIHCHDGGGQRRGRRFILPTARSPVLRRFAKMSRIWRHCRWSI